MGTLVKGHEVIGFLNVLTEPRSPTNSKITGCLAFNGTVEALTIIKKKGINGFIGIPLMQTDSAGAFKKAWYSMSSGKRRTVTLTVFFVILMN